MLQIIVYLSIRSQYSSIIFMVTSTLMVVQRSQAPELVNLFCQTYTF